MRVWEQAAMCARHCWVSESLNPGPSMLWTTMQMKKSFSSTHGPFRNKISSSKDWEPDGSFILDTLAAGFFRLVFKRSHNTWAKPSTTCASSIENSHNYQRSTNQKFTNALPCCPQPPQMGETHSPVIFISLLKGAWSTLSCRKFDNRCTRKMIPALCWSMEGSHW